MWPWMVKSLKKHFELEMLQHACSDFPVYRGFDHCQRDCDPLQKTNFLLPLSSNMNEDKIGIVGIGGVGKTALTHRKL